MTKTAEEIITENLKTIEEWALQGMTHEEIAECLGVSYSNFRKIKAKKVALSQILKQSATLRKNSVKDQIKVVEDSLFKRAKGYNIKKQVCTKVKATGIDENGNQYSKEEVVINEIEEHVPADITAAKFFLVNAAKRRWQDNPHKVENDKEILKIRIKESEAKEW